MNNATINKKDWNAHVLDENIKEVIGEDLYQQCLEIRNNNFIKINKDGSITYHFTRTACEKVYDYIFQHRHSYLYDAYHKIDGYKLSFKM